jgi:hypothetical protein
MPLGQNHGTQVGYNIQISVDAKHNLIVDHDVTNEVNDFNQLERMATRAKEILQVDELEVIADKGYYGWGDESPSSNSSARAYRSLNSNRTALFACDPDPQLPPDRCL